jgi:hypothetical protein
VLRVGGRIRLPGGAMSEARPGESSKLVIHSLWRTASRVGEAGASPRLVGRQAARGDHINAPRGEVMRRDIQPRVSARGRGHCREE